MLKKIVSFLLIFLVLPIYILPTVLAESNVIADLTSVSSIHRCGLAASNKYIKSGSFTMKWDGVNLQGVII